jgi:outer membrane PBP1 activator LpoA protein
MKTLMAGVLAAGAASLALTLGGCITTNGGARPGFAEDTRIVVLLPTTSRKYADAVQAIEAGLREAHASDPSGAELDIVDSKGRRQARTIYETLTGGESPPGAVIGPLLPERVDAVAVAVEDDSPPTLLLNKSRTNSRTFQFALSPRDEPRTVAALFKNAGVSRPVVVYRHGSRWQQQLAETFVEATVGVVVDEAVYDESGALMSGQAELRGADAVFLVVDADTAANAYDDVKKITGTKAIVATSHAVDGAGSNAGEPVMGNLFVVEAPRLLNARSYTGNLERLKAMGVDAYRLAAMISRGEAPIRLPDGESGDITLSEGSITRRLALGRFAPEPNNGGGVRLAPADDRLLKETVAAANQGNAGVRTRDDGSRNKGSGFLSL